VKEDLVDFAATILMVLAFLALIVGTEPERQGIPCAHHGCIYYVDRIDAPSCPGDHPR